MKLVVRYIATSLLVIIFGVVLLIILHKWMMNHFDNDTWYDQKKVQPIGRVSLERNLREQQEQKAKIAKKTGNDLIDKYEENNEMLAGENGRGILLMAEEKEIGDKALKTFKVNTKISDLVPLNRKVPDSRPLP